MDLLDVALFRTIAASGSLSAAGRRMRMTPMVVSRRLAGLEAEVGSRLFHRTTRSLALTPEGETFLPYAVALLETQDAALTSMGASDGGLSGVLKVTAPNVIGHTVIVPVLAGLLADNPSLSMDLGLTDGVVDIAAAGLDVAIRVSPLEPSDLIATRLADNPRVLCASPSYVARFGKPVALEDLAGRPCLRLGGADTWPFHTGGALRRVRVDGPFVSSSVDALRAACLRGVGIAMLTYWDVRALLRQGRLERIELADALPDQLGIWAVYPTRRYVPPRVKAFIDALRKRLCDRDADEAGR